MAGYYLWMLDRLARNGKFVGSVATTVRLTGMSGMSGMGHALAA